MIIIKGSPSRILLGTTIGFFTGFSAVSLFGPTVSFLVTAAKLSPILAGLLISIPNLTGSLLRIPFAGLVDGSGGKRPFTILLFLSLAGVLGVWATLVLGGSQVRSLFPLLLFFGALGGCGIATFSVGIGQTAYWFPKAKQGGALGFYAGLGNLAPGLFTLLLSALVLPIVGLTGAYLLWALFILTGTLIYLSLASNAPYFQLIHSGLSSAEAREISAADHLQELFPRGGFKDSLRTSASNPATWLLVAVYFTTFGGFLALTAWLPLYWRTEFKLGLGAAGAMTASFSVLASLVRVFAGSLSDRIGGERTLGLSALIIISGSILVIFAGAVPLAITGLLLMALGMGAGNAATFKLVPHLVPEAVGGTSGWVGGLGALGGFVLPNLLSTLGSIGQGLSAGFIVFTVLGISCLGMAILLTRMERKMRGGVVN